MENEEAEIINAINQITEAYMSELSKALAPYYKRLEIVRTIRPRQILIDRETFAALYPEGMGGGET